MLLNLKYNRVILAPMEQDAKKQLYEIVFLANPSMLEEEAKDFHQKIKYV